jgi:DNA topoisomerase VI subunit A
MCYFLPTYTQVKTKQKAEIQALSLFGFQYTTEEYLPRKLKEGDWIKGRSGACR